MDENESKIGNASEQTMPAENTAEEKSIPARKVINRKLRSTLIVVSAAMLAAGAAIFAVIWHYSGLMQRPDEVDIIYNAPTVEPLTTEEEKTEEVIDYEKQFADELAVSAEELPFDEDVTNILLFGTDNRGSNDKGSRTDSMIVVSINRRTKQITLTSLMRDIYIKIPNAWTNRLNTAYAIGGADMLTDTLKQRFNMPVSKWIDVDFFSFMDAVDSVGGVDVELSRDVILGMQQYIIEVNGLLGEDPGKDMIKADEEGVHTLNGKQALVYARIRNVSGEDYSRTLRQRTLITKLIEKAKGLSIFELNDLANTVLPQIKTNLSQGEVTFLVINSLDYLDYEVRSLRIPAEGTGESMMVGDMSVIGIDFDANKEIWYNCVYLGEDVPEE